MNKTTVIIYFLNLFGFILNAQVKGATPIPENKIVTDFNKGKTFAVVVGISDYQDPAIPDLRFADRDAEAFSNYLKSPAGGSLDVDHLKVLINKQATMAQFAVALDWLLEVCKSGDQAIIYFSGHGDVERKTVSQPGFLLCWDAPARVYMSGGAYGLTYLAEVVKTLSTQNNAKVMVIADACHSGKLSGSQIGGTQATTANMATQFSNELKILSCQPNEYSLEGEQWGGGRGVFSYYLIDGLIGLADKNNDATVTLNELERYLEDHVTVEVSPQSQIPILCCNKTEKVSFVNAESLKELKKSKTGEIISFVKTESRGIEEDVLSKVDSNTRKNYQYFKEKLDQKIFLSPERDCADYYFRLLQSDTVLIRLHNALRRNYAAALQDDAQQVLNKFLKSEITELTLSKKTASKKYQDYPKYLERAAELLGEKHYMYLILKARKLYFEGFLIALNNKNINKELGNKALEKFKAAIEIQADMPHIYWQMSFVYGYNLMKLDSSEYYIEKATTLSPSWLLPYANMVFLLSEKLKKFDKAKYYLDKMNQIDSISPLVHYATGVYYDNQNKMDAAILEYQKALKADSTYISAHNALANLYLSSEHFELAESEYKKAIQLDSTYHMAHTNLGIVYFATNRLKLAESEFLKGLELDALEPYCHYNLACYFSSQNNLDLAFKYLSDALKFGWLDYATLKTDTWLNPLRERTEEWNALMNQYFPEKK